MLSADLTVAVDLDLTAVFGDLGRAVVDVDLGEVRFDADGVLALVAAAAPPDLSGALTAASTVREVLAGRTSVGLPGAGLSADVRALLDLLDGVGQVVPRLELPDEAGFEALLPQLRAITGAVEGGPLPGLLALLPAVDLDVAVGRVGGALGGLVELVRVLAGLVGTSATTSRLVLGADVLAARLDVPTAAGAGRRLAERAADTALVAAVRAADPDDLAAVEVLVPRLLGLLEAVVDVGDVWSVGMGTGEAALLGLDLTGRTAALELARLALDGADLEAVAALAVEVRTALRPLLEVRLPSPAEVGADLVEQALGVTEELTAALRRWEPAGVVAPVAGVLGVAVAPLQSVRRAVEDVAGAVSSGVRGLRDLVDEVDLGAVAGAVRTALQPVVDTLDAVEEAVGAAGAQVEQVCDALVTALDGVADEVEAVARAVQDGLGRARGVLVDTRLPELAAALREGLASVSAALASAQLSPYFDAAIDVIDTGTAAVEAVPFGMLPTDVQQEVVDLARPVKQLDLEPVEASLRATLDEVRATLDEDALDEVRAAFDAVLEVLRALDPSPLLVELEQGPLAELRRLVDAVDPQALLAPADAALASFRALLAGVDLEREVLAPLADLYAPVEQALAALDPSALLAPVDEAVGAVRQRVLDLLRLDDVEAAVIGLRDRVAGALGSLLVLLTQTAGLDADESAVADVLAWTGAARSGAGPTGPAQVQGRLAQVAGVLQRVRADVGALDPAPLAAAAQAQHRAVVAALAVHPPGSALRLRVDASYAAVVPSQVLGGLAENRRRYLAALGAAGAAADVLAASGRSEVGAAAAGLSAALAPLQVVAARARDLLALLGLDDPSASLGELVRELWSVAGPARLLPAVVELVEVGRDRVLAGVDALLAPVLDTLAEVRAVVAAVDVTAVTAEVAALHAAVVAEVAALSPEALLRPVVDEADAVLDRLAAFDPLGAVREVVDAATGTADRVLDAARPTGLFAPVVELHGELLALATGLDVEVLLRPVLDALAGLGVQLGDGFSRTTDALQRLQAALPDAVEPASGSVSVSASASVSLGG